MMATMHGMPIGALHTRSAFAGTQIRSSSHVSRRQVDVARTSAISAPERLETVDRTEEAQLEQKDAFAELVALSKQSVNRPQKVRAHRDGSCCSYVGFWSYAPCLGDL